MKNSSCIAILGLIGAVGIGVVSCLVWQGCLQLSDGIEIVILGGLILVTIWYAISTHGIQGATAAQVAVTREQAEISKQAMTIAQNAATRAVLPIVRLSRPEINSIPLESGANEAESVGVSYSNIGSGPALNIKVWLSYETGGGMGGERSNIKREDVLGVGEGDVFEWRSLEETLPLPIQASGFDIVAEYTDIYRREFRSTLYLINPYDTEFSFIQLLEDNATSDQNMVK